MKRALVFSCILSVVMLLGHGVFADETDVDTTEYTFSDENVLGELVGVEGVSITSRPRGKEKSLIHVKTHFVYEMLKSVETM